VYHTSHAITFLRFTSACDAALLAEEESRNNFEETNTMYPHHSQ
jgi:hypothetical protein